MTHTVCGSTLISRREPEPDGPLTEMVIYCPTCQRDVPVVEMEE